MNALIIIGSILAVGFLITKAFVFGYIIGVTAGRNEMETEVNDAMRIFGPALLDLHKQYVEGEIDYETFQSELEQENEYVSLIMHNKFK